MENSSPRGSTCAKFVNVIRRQAAEGPAHRAIDRYRRHPANRLVKIQAIDAAGIAGTPAVRRTSETSFSRGELAAAPRPETAVREPLLFPVCFYDFGQDLLRKSERLS